MVANDGSGELNVYRPIGENECSSWVSLPGDERAFADGGYRRSVSEYPCQGRAGD